MQFRTSDKVYSPREDSFLLQGVVARICKSTKPKSVLDMGTGSGIQAVTAKLYGSDKVLAVDLNPSAVKLARRNAKLNAAKINVRKSDLFKRVKGKFDLIIFNPPYLPAEPPIDIQWSGGRVFIEKFLEQAKEYLKPNGKIIFVYSSLDSIKVKHKKLGKEKMPDGEILYVAQV